MATVQGIMESSKDLGSVLSRVEVLEKQLAAREQELKDAKQKEEDARRQVEQLNSVNSKLIETKREAMKQEFNDKVRDWIKHMDPKLVPDPLKDEFLTSCEKFAEKGDDTGVWKVVCCTSAAHQQQVNTIQKLTEDYNALKKSMEGEFRTEESRKRKEVEPVTISSGHGVWEQLEGMCRSY